MLLIFVLLAALIIGYLAGGSLHNYLNKPLRGVILPCAAFMIEASFGKIGEFVDLPPAQWLGYAVCLEYLLLALFILLNWERYGIVLLGVSTAVNFIVIAANGFRMPVSPLVYEYPGLAGLISRIQSGELMEYVLVNWGDPLWFLGDTIPLFNGLASIGDLVMALALLVLVIEIMNTPKEKRSKV